MLDAETKKSVDEFIRKMKEKSEAVHTQTSRAVAQACVLVENTAKKGMTDTVTDPNKAYSRWKGKKVHYASAEGEYPAVDTGTLRRSITHNIELENTSTIGRVGSNLLYARFLETGTSRMMPRPWLYRSVEQNREKIRAVLFDGAMGRTVNIEGTEQ